MQSADTTPDSLGTLDVDRVVRTFAATKAWMNHHYTLWTLALLPLEALTFKLAFRRTGGLNYPAWLVVATFLTAQAFVLQAVGMPLQRAFPDARGWIVMLAMLYGVASLVQYFGRDQARWKVALRAVLGYVLFKLATTALSVLGALAVVLSAIRP